MYSTLIEAESQSLMINKNVVWLDIPQLSSLGVCQSKSNEDTETPQ